MTPLLTALAGGIGALARTEVGTLLAHRSGHGRWGTRSVNLLGAFLLGLVVSSNLSSDAIRILGTGFLGGFTTFSTWVNEALEETGPVATAEIAGQVAAGLVLARLALAVT